MKTPSDYVRYWLISLPVILAMCVFVTPEFVNAAVQDEGIDRDMHDKLAEPSIPDSQLRSADKLWEEEQRFILIGDLQAYGSYSALQDDDLWGGSFYGLVAPGYKVGERSMLLLMYDGQYDRRMELYSDDYGFRKRTEFQRHAITPMLRMDFGENSRYSITPSVFYTSTWNKDEGQESSWDKGLYNYRDAGVGLDFDARQILSEDGFIKVSVQYYKRRYPNYDSLLHQIDASEYDDEKDYHAPLVKLGYYWVRDSGFSWVSEYSILYKRLDDKKIIESTGFLSPSTKQRDYVHELFLKGWYSFEDIGGGLKVGFDIGGRLTDSNENYVFYDGVMAVDVNRDFFDYRSYRIGPNLSYIFELMPLTVRCSYSYEKLDYTDRWARNNDGWGSPKYDDQWETTHDVVIGLQYELTEKLDLLAQWEYTKGGSNNDFETAYTYDYRVNHFILGGKYEF